MAAVPAALAPVAAAEAALAAALAPRRAAPVAELATAAAPAAAALRTANGVRQGASVPVTRIQHALQMVGGPMP